MTGDGVNDTLALKDADIGVAMGSGSPAARAVARFVLLANDFSVFPVGGRRGPPGHRQRGAGRQPVPHQDLLRHGPRPRRRRGPAPLPVHPPALHDHLGAHDRHPRLLPRPGTEQPPRPHGVPPPGAAVRHPHRARRGDGDVRRLSVRARPGRREPRGGPHGRGHRALPRRPVGAGDPGPTAQLVAGRARGRHGAAVRRRPDRPTGAEVLRPRPSLGHRARPRPSGSARWPRASSRSGGGSPAGARRPTTARRRPRAVSPTRAGAAR